MEYPLEKKIGFEDLDDVGRYLAESGMTEILGHGTAEVWVYKSRKTGKIKYTYTEAIAEDGDDPRYGRIPRNCLNDDRTAITFMGKRRAIKFAMDLQLDRNAVEYVVEWNYEESSINPAQPLYKPDTGLL